MKLSRQLILLLAILSFSACQKEVGPDTDTPTGYESFQSKSEKRGVAFNFSQLPDIDIPKSGAGLQLVLQLGRQCFRRSILSLCPIRNGLLSYGLERQLE